ncbi:hypothetical protein [Paenibacillus silvisoli]|uniref:hypothetical protein n=1 Tax=Paenibacillus silvisoli TaxID=3110539 RepID=UPI00280570BE|nr:hypothetical protein [Paenibacillus silvisoli]
MTATAATDVGAIRARMELDAQGFNDSLTKAKQSMNQSTADAKKTTQQIRELRKSLLEAGVSSAEMRKIQRELKAVKPEILEQELMKVEIQLRKIGASSEHIEKVKQQMRDAQQEAKETVSRMEALSNALVSIGAGTALAGIINVVRSFAAEANNYINAQRGLEEVAKALGTNLEETNGSAQELAGKGFMSLAEASSAIKTLLSSGLNLEQIKKLMLATADAAAYNRESHLSWGEAIVQVAQGIKTGNSELTDAAGITTNLSVMYDRFASSIGTTEDKLSDAQKVQAAYNGILSEASMYAGNADSALQGYNGTQAQFSQTLATARSELGEAFLPLLQELMELAMPIIKAIVDWAKENQGLVVGLTAGTAAVLAITAAVTALVPLIYTLTTAAVGLEIALGPIGLAIAAIGLVVGGFAAYSAGASSASQSALEFANNQDVLNAKLMQSPLNMQVEEYKKLTASIDTLNPVMEKRNQLMDEYNAKLALAQSGKGSVTNTHEMLELADAIKQVDKELRGLGFESGDAAADALGRMKEQAKGAVGAQIALEEENVRVLSGQVKHIDAMTKLQKQYEGLSSKEKLSTQQKQQLADTVKQLKQEYPDLIVQLDEEGKWHINNVDALNQLIDAEKNTVEASSEGSKQRLEIAKKEAQARIDLLKPQLKAMQALENKPIPEPTIPGLGNFTKDALGRVLHNTMKDTSSQINEAQAAVLQAERDIQAITTGNLSIFDRPLPGSSGTDTKTDTKKGKTQAQIQQEQYQASLKHIDMQRQLNRMSESEELSALGRLQERYKKNGEIRNDLEVRIYQLKKQMEANEKRQQEDQLKKSEESTKKKFQASSEWIEQEEKRMRLAGKSEADITAMKLTAWTRVRNRYSKDSEFYKQADNEVYSNKIELMEREDAVRKELDKEREEQIKHVTNVALDAIAKEEKAELDALDERRKEIDRYYDDKKEAIDDSERVLERKELITELEKYRLATSEQGRAKYKELQDKLRKMDNEDEKRKLDKERQERLDALDQQKADIESWYDDLKAVFEEFSGEMTPLYQLLEDERYKAFTTTNEKIRADLAQLASDYAMISGGSAPASAANASSPANQSSSGLKRFKETLASGAVWTPEAGGYVLNGEVVRTEPAYYHTGGIAGQAPFRLGDMLMPDEISSILQVGEVTMTPKQVGHLIGEAQQAASVVNNYNAPLIQHSGDVRLEDEADIRSYWGERDTIAQRLIAKGERL